MLLSPVNSARAVGDVVAAVAVAAVPLAMSNALFKKPRRPVAIAAICAASRKFSGARCKRPVRLTPSAARNTSCDSGLSGNAMPPLQ